MVKRCLNYIKTHKIFCNYLLISISVTIIDVVLSRMCEFFVSEVIANTIGVVVGFVIQYFLCTKKVFIGRGLRTGAIFLITWLFGLALADSIVYIVRVIVFHNSKDLICFLVGKGASMIIPFFITYFLRRKFIKTRQ